MRVHLSQGQSFQAVDKAEAQAKDLIILMFEGPDLHAEVESSQFVNALDKDVFKGVHESEQGGRALVNKLAGDKVSWFCDRAAVEGVTFHARRVNL